MTAILETLVPYLPAVATVAAGLFAFAKWLDQRRREAMDRRFEQYWKLIQTSQGSQYLAEQKVALLLLKRFPEFKVETITFLLDARERGSPWWSSKRSPD